MKRFFLTLTCAGLCAWTAPAAEEAAAKAELDKLFRQFEWVKGPAVAGIGDIAEIKVPAGYKFTGAKGTRGLLEAFGNPTSGDELGFLTRESMDWSIVFEFSDVGYVKDDDKDKLDSAKMLKSIRAGTEEANKLRQKMGSPPIVNVDWQLPPRYNEQTHNLEWAIKGESEGEPLVNYNTRLLGRRGVMSVTLLVDPKDMNTTLPAYQALLADYSFKTGQRYAEFRSGDKIAQYGLAALVVGGAAVGAAKLGLFASLAVLLKKAWKFVVVAVVAVVAALRRFLFGERRARVE
jgi:uncharacterized membrane-anchored protein